VPLQGMRDALQLMPGARGVVIEATGHAPFVAAPARVAQVLKRFLQERQTDAIEN
jgi:pimeloyl-ACP methyl ester carboxylesterase